jgi:hypothetical protein
VRPSCTFAALIGLVIMAVCLIGAGSFLYWHPEVCSAITESPINFQIPLLAIGIGVLAVVVLIQWWTIANLWRVNSIPLSEVERLHPRLPGALEVIITVLLSIVILTFFMQMSSAVLDDFFSLSSSTKQRPTIPAISSWEILILMGISIMLYGTMDRMMIITLIVAQEHSFDIQRLLRAVRMRLRQAMLTATATQI